MGANNPAKSKKTDKEIKKLREKKAGNLLVLLILLSIVSGIFFGVFVGGIFAIISIGIVVCIYGDESSSDSAIKNKNIFEQYHGYNICQCQVSLL